MSITSRNVRGTFYENLQIGPAAWINELFTPVLRTEDNEELYAWLGQVPRLTKFSGKNKFDELNEFDWAVSNEKYQNGLRLPRYWIENDKTDMVNLRVGEFADAANSHWIDIFFTLLLGAEAGICYDGQFFFDTDHSEGESGVQANKGDVSLATIPASVTGSPTNPSPAQMAGVIIETINRIIAFKDDRGYLCNENMSNFLVMVPPNLHRSALTAITATVIDGGDTNMLRSQSEYSITVKSTPRINAWTDKFVVFALDGRRKPFLRQQKIPRNPAGMYNFDGILYWELWTGSEHYKKEDEVLINIETERGARYGDWRKAYQVTMTA